MKLSCTPFSLGGTIRSGEMDLEGWVRFAAEQGLDGVDLLDSHGYPWLWKETAGRPGRVVEWARREGVAIAGYGCSNNFAVADPERHRCEVENARFALREAAEAGAPFLRIFGGTFEGVGNGGGYGGFALAYEQIRRGLDLLLVDAERCGVVLALENHGRLPGHAWELRSLVESHASPWLRVLFDYGNFLGNSMDEPQDPLRAWPVLAAYVVGAHYKDFRTAAPGSGRKFEPCRLGAGVVPVRQLTAEMVRSGYDGFFSLECGALPGGSEKEGVVRCLEDMREMKRLFERLKP
ncbi:MAG TPA: sugar phosphate isomerase/epimerase family protein [Chthoniobacteraceae bacterium]|nr:sugar phosphate isomerase/epimerase family protein [Chthoniobacteraceae bacterium]